MKISKKIRILVLPHWIKTQLSVKKIEYTLFAKAMKTWTRTPYIISINPLQSLRLIGQLKTQLHIYLRKPTGK